MAIVTDIKWREPNGTIRSGWYLDKWLAQNLDKIPQHLYKGWDCLAIVSGSGLVRVGKCHHLGVTKLKIWDDKNLDIINSDYLANYPDGQIFKTVSWDFNNHRLRISDSLLKKTGKKKVFEVETEDGKKCTITDEHKIFIKRKDNIIELKLKDVKVGDEFVCHNNL
jgi:hypothetical protein